MHEYQKRVVEEKEELDKKIASLEKFVTRGNNEVYDKLPREEQGRLIAQLQAMMLYSKILGYRIEAFDH